MSINIRKVNPIITYCHLIGAFMVFWGHWNILSGIPVVTLLGEGIQGWGVRFLFLISGYLSWKSVCKNQETYVSPFRVILEFLRKKVIRLFPPLWVCLIVTILVLYFISESREVYWLSAIKYFLSNAILIPRHEVSGVFQDNPYPIAVNGSLWTLPVEMACYISVPILSSMLSFNNRHQSGCKNRKLVSIMTLLFISIAMQLCLQTQIFEKVPAISHIATSSMVVIVWFFVGEIFCCIESRIVIRLIGIVGIIVSILVPTYRSVIIPYVVGALFNEMVYWGAKEHSIFSRLPSIKDICYGMYLYGFPIEQIIVYLFTVKGNGELSNMFMFMIALVIDIGFAIGSYYWVERPISRFALRRRVD